MRLFHLVALAALVLISGCTTTKDDSDELMQKSQRFVTKIARTVQLDYLLFLPESYRKTGAPSPVMLFLHGAGERGTNVQTVGAHGPPKIVKTKKDFPFVLISPQCPPDQTWRDDEVLALLDDVVKKHNIDTNRIYLTGL